MKWISLFGIIAVIIGCDSISGKKQTPVFSVRKLLSIGGPDEDVLFQWVGVAVDEDKNIYISDTMDYSLKKFDSQGVFLKKAGRRGQAPSEFLAPRNVSYLNRRVYVDDENNRCIQVFNIELEYLYSIPLRFPAHDFEALSDDSFYVVSLQPTGNYSLISINSKGDIVSQIKLDLAASKDIYNAMSFALDEKGNIYIAYNFYDRIEKADNQGRVIWSRELLNGVKAKLENKFGRMLPTAFVYKDISVDRNQRVYVLGGSYSENRSRDVYILNSEGTLIGKLVLPDTSHCIYVDAEGHIYSRANEGTSLIKMEIEYEDGERRLNDKDNR